MELFDVRHIIIILLLILSLYLLAFIFKRNVEKFLSRSETNNKTYLLINDTGNRVGNAVVITRYLAVSAQHVAEKGDKVHLINEIEEKNINGEVVEEDKDYDLCLIKLDRGIGEYTKLRSDIPQKTKRVIIYLNRKNGIFGNIIYSFYTDKGNKVYVADVGGEKGNSGAGIFDRRGNLIGIVQSVLESQDISNDIDSGLYKKYVVFLSPVLFYKTVCGWKDIRQEDSDKN